MTDAGLLGLAAAFVMAFSTIFPAMAQGKTAAAAMEAIARQPEAAGDIRTSLILALAFIEALTIYGLLVAFLLIGNIG